MARTTAVLPPGSRVTDFISSGILARAFPVEKVRAALAASGRTSLRQRDLPAHVVVYYVLALSLYMRKHPGATAVVVQAASSSGGFS